jgi:hypothetical protein
VLILSLQGYGLYLEFRPESDGWGKKAEMKMSTILDLRRFLTYSEPSPAPAFKQDKDGAKVKIEDSEGNVEAVKSETLEGGDEPANKRAKVEEAEDVKPDLKSTETESQAKKGNQEEKDEFDALLDDDDGIDYSAIDI